MKKGKYVFSFIMDLIYRLSLKNLVVFCLLVVFCFSFYGIWFWATWHKGYESAAHLVFQESQTDLKTILLFTPFDGSYGTWRKRFPGPILNCSDGKSVYNCRVTSDHNFLENSSAVLVSISDINRLTWTWMPSHHKPSPSQKWVALWGEAPQFFYRGTTFDSPRAFSSLNGIFSWTGSYRKDSTFPNSYFHRDSKDNCSWQHSQKRTPIQRDAILSVKSDLVLWIVSHCTTTSHRERYIDELKKYVPVTVLGECGEWGQDQNAFGHLAWHKFYLSFENSLCDDYITEKFFNILHSNTVPIVMGPKKQDYLRVAPPHSFIHVADFPSIQALAEYITYLDNNHTAYMEYLEWKENYVMECSQSWSCQLCKSLHDKTIMEKSSEIVDFMDMWESSLCYNSWDYHILSTQK